MRNVLCRNVGLLQKFKRLESDDETGIIALESSLDTAIHALDYRLSKAKDTTAHTIYEYHIFCLRCKIDKTHKKYVASVSSLSVSPNKYASLVVEDVGTQYTTDCGHHRILCFSFCVRLFLAIYRGPQKGLSTRHKTGCA